jgi:hypothetical protein
MYILPLPLSAAKVTINERATYRNLKCELKEVHGFATLQFSELSDFFILD